MRRRWLKEGEGEGGRWVSPFRCTLTTVLHCATLIGGQGEERGGGGGSRAQLGLRRGERVEGTAVTDEGGGGWGVVNDGRGGPSCSVLLFFPLVWRGVVWGCNRRTTLTL